MEKQIFENKKIGEKYTLATHQSGLKIYLCEKKDFRGAYAVYGTRYGSIDNVFRIKGEKEWTTVPEGIAHYLEHKLFESEDGDAFERYSKTGASANAYTSFDRTCYLFSCTDRFYDSFDILLDFVQHPYFTEQTVQKEQGIIGQEIRMYDDSPSWVLLLNLFTIMYKNNPVRINIAGTAQTIAKINADLLYKCYDAFYNPANMFITVCGNVDTERVLEAVEKGLKPVDKKEVEQKPYDEPTEVMAPYISQEMPVSLPLFALGFKQDCEGYRSVKERVETEMLLELIIGSQTDFYNELMTEGLINKEFSATYFEGRNYACILFSGESRDPAVLAERIKARIKEVLESGIDENKFESVRRQFYGSYVMNFNNVETVGDMLTGCACSGAGLFDEAEIYENMTAEDLNKRAKESFDFDRLCLSVIEPVKDDEDGSEDCGEDSQEADD